MNNINQYKYDNILFLLLIFLGFTLCVLSYWPGMVQYSYFASGLSGIRMYFTFSAYACFGLVLVAKFFDFIKSASLITFAKIYIICLIIGLFSTLFSPQEILPDEYNLLVAFIAFATGISTEFQFKHIKMGFIAYSLVALIVATAQIKSSGVGFEFTAQYLIEDKNATCVIWGLCAVGLIFFSVINPFNLTSIFCFALSFGFILCILLSRGRAALLAAAFSIAIILLKRSGRFSAQKIFLIMCLMFTTAILFISFKDYFYSAGNLVFESVATGKDIYDLDSLSSGRMTRNYIAIENFIKSPLFGQLESSFQLKETGQVHNYLLRILSSYGIALGIPFAICYIMLWYYTMKRILHHNKFEPLPLADMGIYMMFFLLIISMLEVTQPCGPGTSSCVGMFFFGNCLKLALNRSSEFVKY